MIMKFMMLILPFLFAWNVSNANNKDLKIKLASLDYIPYYGKEMRNHGPVSEIIIEAFKEKGYQAKNISIDFLPWNRALAASKNGAYHGLFAVWFNQERTQWFHFSDKLPPNEVGFYINAEEQDKLKGKSLSGLKGYRIGWVRGYSVPDIFKKEIGEDQLIITEDDVTLMRLLVAKRISLAMSDKQVGIHATNHQSIEKLKKRNNFKMKWLKTIESKDQHLAFPKNLAKSITSVPNNVRDSQKLLNDFNSGLKIIKEKGLIKKIYDSHGLSL